MNASGASCGGDRVLRPALGDWQALVADIAELEELIGDLGDQDDALSLLNRRRLAALLRYKRGLLRAALNRAPPVARAPG